MITRSHRLLMILSSLFPIILLYGYSENEVYALSDLTANVGYSSPVLPSGNIFTVEILNLGDERAKNLRFNFIDPNQAFDFIVEKPLSPTVLNAKGDRANMQFKVFPRLDGSYNVTMSLSWEDGEGNIHAKVVNGPMDMPLSITGITAMNDNVNMFDFRSIILISAGVGVIAVVGTILIVKRKKKV